MEQEITHYSRGKLHVGQITVTNTNVTSRRLNTSWSIFIEQLVNTFVKWYRKSSITELKSFNVKRFNFTLNKAGHNYDKCCEFSYLVPKNVAQD
jgi:hypothetical protein